MTNTGIIYRIFNINSGKSYIGKTSRDFYVRMGEHIKYSYTQPQKKLYAAFRKYGIESFSAEIIGTYDLAELNTVEAEYIRKFDSYSNGYNANFGGEGRPKIIVDDLLLSSTYDRLSNNISFTSKELDIGYSTCRALLESAKILTKTKRGRKIVIEDVNIEFDNSYECAKFLKYCDIVSPEACSKITARSIRKVCSIENRSYKGLKFSYL